MRVSTGLPALVVALDGTDATVDLGGVRKEISVALVEGVAFEGMQYRTDIGYRALAA